MRDTYDRISTTIARFSFVRAVVFAIGAFALASALNEVGSSDTMAPLFVKVAASILAIALWIFPIWSWMRYRHIRYKSGPARWPSAQRWLLRWYYPQIIVAALFIITALLSESKPLIGAPIFILGIAILATAYSTVETAARFATNKRSVRQGIARRPVESIA